MSTKIVGVEYVDFNQLCDYLMKGVVMQGDALYVNLKQLICVWLTEPFAMCLFESCLSSRAKTTLLLINASHHYSGDEAD